MPPTTGVLRLQRRPRLRARERVGARRLDARNRRLGHRVLRRVANGLVLAGSEDYFFYALDAAIGQAAVAVRNRSGHRVGARRRRRQSVRRQQRRIPLRAHARRRQGGRGSRSRCGRSPRLRWPASRSSAFRRSTARPRRSTSTPARSSGRPISAARSNPRRSYTARPSTWRRTRVSCMRCGKAPLDRALSLGARSFSSASARLSAARTRSRSSTSSATAWGRCSTSSSITRHVLTPTRAIDAALAEIVRLDQVMSHYKADSHLSTLHREGGQRVRRRRAEPVRGHRRVAVVFPPFGRQVRRHDRARCSGHGKTADAEGRRPSEAEIADGTADASASRRSRRALRIAFASAPTASRLDLGGIGKGYAVDRAIAMLDRKASGTRWSTPGEAPSVDRRATRHRRGGRSPLAPATSCCCGTRRCPPRNRTARSSIPEQDRRPRQDGVSVVTRSGTAADALSTTLLMIPIEEGMKLLDRFPDASAIWILLPAAWCTRVRRIRGSVALADSR